MIDNYYTVISIVHRPKVKPIYEEYPTSDFNIVAAKKLQSSIDDGTNHPLIVNRENVDKIIVLHNKLLELS